MNLREKLICALAASTVMTGCASMGGSAGVDWAAMNPGAVPDYNEANSQAKDAIRHFLKDPDSAQFRSTTPFFKTLYNFGFGAAGSYEPLWAMCIEVNAKNSYGGYTGYQNWLVKFRNGQAVRDELGVMRADYDCQNGPSQVARVAG